MRKITPATSATFLVEHGAPFLHDRCPAGRRWCACLSTCERACAERVILKDGWLGRTRHDGSDPNPGRSVPASCCSGLDMSPRGHGPMRKEITDGVRRRDTMKAIVQDTYGSPDV